MSRPAPRHVELDGRHRIDAGIEETWRELNNPDALAYSIRQCRHMERLAPERFRAHFKVGVGPVKVPVTADLDVLPEDPPRRYRLNCRLALKVLGDAEGEASVDLAEDGDAVWLDYRARVTVAGRLAGYGLDYLRGAVERNVDSFFTRFGEWMASR